LKGKVIDVPIISWNVSVIDGIDYLVVDMAKFRIPLEWDPNSNAFLAIAVPDGGIGNFPALVQGDPGVTPVIDNFVNLTVLDHDDTTPDFASFSEPTPNVYELNMSTRKGPQGDPGVTTLDPSDFASPAAGKALVVNAANDGFELASPKVGDSYWPTSILNTPSGNAGFTLCSVGIPPQPFAWRPRVSGWCVITGTGADVAVDLLARLDNATAGNIVAHGYDRTGGISPPTHRLENGPPTGSADGYNRVAVNTAATIYLRAERRSGTETFTTSNTTTRFCVTVEPIP
jgi:hypothetical protein